ncbi:MAG: DNA topoisomerase [Myxococcota bacterium]
MPQTKRLVIAEKPSVARDLAAALGPYEDKEGGEWFETADLVIAYAVGHLLELAPPERYNEDWKRWTLRTLPIIPERFIHEPRDRKASSRLKLLRKLAKRSDVVGLVNACDAGREGEHIFRTILAELGRELPAERLWLSSLTAGAIRDGFRELRPHEHYDPLGAAAACRSEADWLIGINATRALTGRLRSLGYSGAWTSGRVQTPTLAMCVARELEIQAHRPEPYWEIKATFQAKDHAYEAMFRLPKGQGGNNPTRIFDQAEMERLKALLRKGAPGTASETRKRRKDSPPLPFDLTTLQRASGLTAKRTQDIAQALYERHKVLSYPRTDSRYLPADQRPTLDTNLDMLKRMRPLAPVVDAIRAKGVQNEKKVFNDSKVTDHHAIIPVGTPRPGQLDDTEYRIYMMVVRQYLAAFMEPAWWESVTRWTYLEGERPGEQLRFHASGRRLVEAGYQLAMGKEVGHGSSLAKLDPSEDAPVTLDAFDVEESETKPKGRLSDAGLVARMENCGKDIEDEELSEIMRERGLGTPATRADTIERLINRGYLAREGKSLRATAKAIRLIETLRRAGALKLTEPELTGEMEYKLRQVEQGRLERIRYMDEVVDDTKLITDILVSFDFDDLYAGDPDIAPCPGHPDRKVHENVWGFTCTGEQEDEEEPFFIWKDVGGHVLTPQEMQELLERDDHQIGPVTLYPRNNPRGGGYEAYIALRRLSDEEYEAIREKSKKRKKKNGRKPSRWTTDIKPVGGAADAAADVDEERIGTLCTIPGDDGETEIVETNVRYVDAAFLAGERTKPRAVLPKRVCERPMSKEEATQFFTEGKTDFLEDFTSRRGRPFKAKLYLKNNGRHGFEFEPRKPRKKKATAKKAGTKKSTARKSTAKKSTAKKGATRKKSTKKAGESRAG